MKRKQNAMAKTVVIILSLGIAVVSFGLSFVYRLKGQPTPVYLTVGMTYGGVFVVFLLFDVVGKGAARLRNESSAAPRPRPRPAAQQGPVMVSVEEVRLRRARVGDEPALQALCDEALTELYALEERRPSVDANGHVTDVQASDYVTGDSGKSAFFIQVGETDVGCCVLSMADDEANVILLYVASAFRRRRIGTAAVSRLREFIQLLGNVQILRVEAAEVNFRGQKFLESLHFSRSHEDVQSLSTWTLSIE